MGEAAAEAGAEEVEEAEVVVAAVAAEVAGPSTPGSDRSPEAERTATRELPSS
jgi:hypothetical protein